MFFTLPQITPRATARPKGSASPRRQGGNTHPPRCLGQTARIDDARAHLCPYQPSSRRQRGKLRGDRLRLHRAQAAQKAMSASITGLEFNAVGRRGPIVRPGNCAPERSPVRGVAGRSGGSILDATQTATTRLPRRLPAPRNDRGRKCEFHRVGSAQPVVN